MKKIVIAALIATLLLVLQNIPSVDAAENEGIGTDAYDDQSYLGSEINKGDRGPVITEYQVKLINLGYNLPIYGADGIFGSETESAVKQFQTKNSITVDGIIGEKTSWLIDELSHEVKYTYSSQYKLTHPYMKDGIIGEIQHYVGANIDGIYGPKTEAAVKVYQERNGLHVDGIVGKETWNSIFKRTK